MTSTRTHAKYAAYGITAWVLVAFMCMGCSPAPHWERTAGTAWGTTYHITYESPRDLGDSIAAVVETINQSLSMFSPSSRVSRINAGATDTVDACFAAVYELSRKVSDASGGRFDPTVAPLTDLWGFGRKEPRRELPDSAEVAAALARVGIGKTRISDGRIFRQRPDMEFDFSAVAKGFGVGEVAKMLERNGCRNFMVEIGGEIALRGHSPSGRAWRIQVDAPVAGSAPGDSSLTVLELTDCAIATSGNYRNFKEMGGTTVGHTLDPATGYPSQRDVVSATVIAADCGLADALATALMASPADSAAAIIGCFPNTRAILVRADGTVQEINF